jgi:transcriptional regulator with XRE-family HTH domain
MSELGAKVKQLRRSQDMSQRALARASGLTPSYVSKIESDSLPTPPSSDAVVSLAKALDADEIQLLSAAGRVPSPFEIVGSQPQATHFFRRAAARIQDPEDWDRLTEVVESSQFGPSGSHAKRHG